MKFVIWAPSFEDTNGGAIVLHLLCDSPNRSSLQASIWPMYRPPAGISDTLKGVRRAIAHPLLRPQRLFVWSMVSLTTKVEVSGHLRASLGHAKAGRAGLIMRPHVSLVGDSRAVGYRRGCGLSGG
jgi:hypothetical protein